MCLCLLFRRASVSKSLRQNSLLKYNQSDYKKSLGRIFGAATPPGALVCILVYLSPSIIASIFHFLIGTLALSNLLVDRDSAFDRSR